jgi:hypothetical protein
MGKNFLLDEGGELWDRYAPSSPLISKSATRDAIVRTVWDKHDCRVKEQLCSLA